MKKILLHTCCAPCSVSCVDSLRAEGIEPVSYWFNPNIHPYKEYQARKRTLEAYAKSIDMKLIKGGRYDVRGFLSALDGELGGGRCAVCYRMRFEQTAKYAAENGYSSFSSTLFISPYQNHELMLKTAEECAKEYGVSFLHRDFRPLFREGQDRARELGLYMQKYCGCILSEADRYEKRPKKQSGEKDRACVGKAK